MNQSAIIVRDCMPISERRKRRAVAIDEARTIGNIFI